MRLPTITTTATIVGCFPQPAGLIDRARLGIITDGGMQYLPREAATGQPQAMVAAARILCAEHGAA